MTSLPPDGAGDDIVSDPASTRPPEAAWRPPAPDDIPPIPSLLSDEVWLPEQPAGPPSPTHFRVTDEESAWWNGWEWHWDKQGELLGQVPWPFIVLPGTVTWARRLCIVQGAALAMFGLVGAGVLVAKSVQGTASWDRDATTAVTIAGMLGIAAFNMYFGNTLLRMSRGVLAVITCVEIVQTAGTIVAVQAVHVLPGYLGLAVPLTILALLWLGPGTRRGFATRGRMVPGPTGAVVLRVVSPRRIRGLVPAHPPGPPLLAPPPRPQRYR